MGGLSKATWLLLARAWSLLEKQHKDLLFLQLTAVFYWRNFLLLSILSVFVFETHRGGQTVPYIYLSSRYHLKVSRDMHCHKQIILTVAHVHSYVEQRLCVHVLQEVFLESLRFEIRSVRVGAGG